MKIKEAENIFTINTKDLLEHISLYGISNEDMANRFTQICKSNILYFLNNIPAEIFQKFEKELKMELVEHSKELKIKRKIHTEKFTETHRKVKY